MSSDDGLKVDWDSFQSQCESVGSKVAGLESHSGAYLTPKFQECTVCAEKFLPIVNDEEQKLCPACFESFDSDTSTVVLTPGDGRSFLDDQSVEAPLTIDTELSNSSSHCQCRDCESSEPVLDTWLCKGNVRGCKSAFCQYCASKNHFHPQYCKDCKFTLCECGQEVEDCYADTISESHCRCSNAKLGCGAVISSRCAMIVGNTCDSCKFAGLDTQREIITAHSVLDMTVSSSTHTGVCFPIDVFADDVGEWIPATAKELVSILINPLLHVTQ